jgi:hypothetical protein
MAMELRGGSTAGVSALGLIVRRSVLMTTLNCAGVEKGFMTTA